MEAEEKKRQEEKERREYEEYLALKASFAVEEEGFDENVEEGSEGNKLQEFIQYIKVTTLIIHYRNVNNHVFFLHLKDTKVVLLEDLAAHFKMKAQDTIDRVTQLSSEGVLTGLLSNLDLHLWNTCQGVKRSFATLIVFCPNRCIMFSQRSISLETLFKSLIYYLVKYY